MDAYSIVITYKSLTGADSKVEIIKHKMMITFIFYTNKNT